MKQPRQNFASLARILIFFLGATLGAGRACADSLTFTEPMACGVSGAQPVEDSVLREQTLETPAGRIAYYRFGSGTPLVLITGYRATLEEWNASFLAELAKSHEVIVFDNRGVGRSSTGDANFDIQDMANDAAALIRGLGLRQVTVVGWSMGGMVAQQLAFEHPRWLERLVLLSTQAPGPHGIPVSPTVADILSGRSKSSFAAVMGVLFPASAVPEAMRCFVADMFKPADYEKSPFPQSVTAAQGNILTAWRADAAAYDKLGSITIPTQVIAGSADEVLSPANAEVLARAIPHARLLEIRGAGHAAMYQYPLELARLIAGTPALGVATPQPGS